MKRLDRDEVEDVGMGYWEIPPEIDPRAYRGQTPEQEARINRFISELYWNSHDRDERPPRDIEEGRA